MCVGVLLLRYLPHPPPQKIDLKSKICFSFCNVAKESSATRCCAIEMKSVLFVQLVPIELDHVLALDRGSFWGIVVHIRWLNVINNDQLNISIAVSNFSG